jgi:hypothetical protein
MLIFRMLIVIMLSGIMLSGIMLSGIMLSGTMLSAVKSLPLIDNILNFKLKTATIPLNASAKI